MIPGRNTAGLILKKDLFFFALFIALFLLVFREFFFTNRVFYERDSTVVEIPVKKLTVQLLKEGNFALWTDAHGNGQPFMANPKNAVFYPTTWLYFFLSLFTAFKLHYRVARPVCPLQVLFYFEEGFLPGGVAFRLQRHVSLVF